MKKIYFAFLLSLFVFVTGAAAQKNRLIGDVQGDKNTSPYAGETARVSGIVTARVKNGFFIQTPDDKTDANPNTSEGLFIFTQTEPGGEATVGNLVSVTGTIDEFTPRAQPLSLPITQIRMQKGRDFITVDAKGATLPKPVVLTVEDFKPNMLDQLEKYEGMRVMVAEMTATSATKGRDGTSDGTFYGVVKGIPRPFREPGLDAYDYFLLNEKDRAKMQQTYPKLSIFDNNPERLRVESATQLGAQALDVTAFAEIKNLTGVLYYAYRAYSILVDAGSKPAISGFVRAEPLPLPREREFSVAGLNVENMFDDEDDPEIKEDIVKTEDFQLKLKKVSAAIRTYMQTPDVIGIIEVENLAVLKKLADRINADAEAAGKPNPKYEAFLIDGNDPRGIDSGFLVKTARLKVVETKQFGKEDKFTNPVSKKDVFLNDRPPLMIRVALSDPKTNQDFEFTVIANHLKSFNGYNDEKDAPFVRMKKKLQGEFLARLVQERQKANPKERIALIGDFNAYQFNDGIVDLIGTIKGAPAAKDSVMNASEDLLDGELTDLVDLIKAEQRYSYSFDGNAQVLDHIIINAALKNHIRGFGYARLNADFPEVYRNDATRVERFSDHDAAVALFTLDAK
jgi:predicted extracellular nuclease